MGYRQTKFRFTSTKLLQIEKVMPAAEMIVAEACHPTGVVL